MNFAFVCWRPSDHSRSWLGLRLPVGCFLLFLLTTLISRAQTAVLPAPSDRSEGVPANPMLTWSYSETNLLSNGGFEDGTNGWDIAAAQRVARFVNLPPAEGSFLLRGVGGVIRRDLMLPAGPGGLRLSFKALGGSGAPNLLVELTDESGPPLRVGTVANTGNSWRTYGADLSPWAGRPVRLTWQIVTNDTTAWGLDDVRLTAVPVGTEFEVWFGTNQLAELTPLGRTSVPSWPLRFLPADRRLFWRVDTIQSGVTNRGPVWEFRTRRFLNLSQLLVDPLPPLLCAQQSVTLGLQLVDEGGFPGRTLDSSRKVWPVVEAVAEDRPPPPVVITELSLTTETIEFQNLSSQALDLSGWSVDALPGAVPTSTNAVRVTVPPGSLLQPGARFELQMGRFEGGSWPRLTSATNLFWSSSRRASVILRDPTGAVVDCVFYDQASVSASLGTRPGQTRAVGIAQWRGAAVTNAIPFGWTVQRAGNRDLNSASDWVFAPASPFARNANLVTPFVPGVGPVPVTAPTGPFTTDRNGYFTLPVQFTGPDSNVVVYATVYPSPSNPTGLSGRTEPLTLADEICLTVELPPSVVETAGTLSGGLRVRIPAPRDTNVLVRLRSPGAAAEGVVSPAELMIPAGATESVGDLTVTDDTELTGPRGLRLFAEADGYVGTQVAWVIEDNETATLRLELASVIAESSQVTGTLLVEPPPARPVSVRLFSNDPARLQLASLSNEQEVVTIGPGARETPFAAVAIDNPNLERSTRTVVRAEFANWTPAQVVVEITDNETNTITVLGDGSESLKEGQPATEFQVVLGGLVTNAVVPLTVTFDPPGRIRPPLSQVILPGAGAVALPLEAVDDSLKNGRTFVTVRISAPDWQSAVFTLPVFDNEPARFRVQLPPGPLPLNQPFTITAAPESVDGFALPFLWFPDVNVVARDTEGRGFVGQVGPTFANEEGMQIPVTLTQGGGMMRFRVEANSQVGPVVGESAPEAVWNVPTAQNLSSLVFDEARNRLLALSPQQPLVALDLASGARRSPTPDLPWVEQAVWAGGDILYAGWLGNRELARINLTTLESGITWPVGTLFSGSPLYLRHSLPLPGQSDALIVAREGAPGTEFVVFEGTNTRPVTARLDTDQALTLLPGQSPGQVFAVTPDRIEEFAVTPEGIQRVTKLWSLRLNYDWHARPGDHVISQGQLITRQGELLDPGLPGRLGENPPDFRPNTFAADPHTGRLASYQIDSEGRVLFRVFDPLTLREVWRRTRFDKPSQNPSALVSAGPHRWALLVNGRLQLETDEAPDPAPSTDLAISVAAVTRHPATSSAVVQWRIENRGTNPAPDVRLMVAFPEARDRGPAALLITAMSTNAVTGTNGLGGTNYLLGDLAPGASVEVTADLRAALNGRLDAAAWVGSAAADSDPSNNRAAVTAEGLDPQLTLSISSPDAEQLLRLEFPTSPGWNYHLDYALTPNGSWEGAASYRGTGQPISLTLHSRDSASRFWRLTISDP